MLGMFTELCFVEVYGSHVGALEEYCSGLIGYQLKRHPTPAYKRRSTVDEKKNSALNRGPSKGYIGLIRTFFPGVYIRFRALNDRFLAVLGGPEGSRELREPYRKRFRRSWYL